ncbi:Protein spire -like protein 2 [Halotydeus destructor]|nr:Protein spire -like protein 2 [Halotydeus destructor]
MDPGGNVTLDSIVGAFNEPLKEEQAWAICYQCAKYLIKNRTRAHQINKLSDILIHKDGRVLVPVIDPGSPKRKSSEKKLISQLGVVLYKALDHGCDENEERQLSPPLSSLIERLTTADECGRDSCDEGIERDADDDNKSGEESLEMTDSHHDNGSGVGITLDKVIEICSEHLASSDHSENHYRAVCRALVAEALELTTFLSQISLKKSSRLEIESQDALSDLLVADWARIWMQVMRELRLGVKLKKVDLETHFLSQHPIDEFELTPYEMLLDDIRSQRYKLNKVIIDYNSISPRVRKDAHALILEFIRSRPPLVPVSKRKLPPAPQKEKTLYEKLMASIQEQHHLRPTPQPLVRHGSIHLGRIREDRVSNNSDDAFSSTSSSCFRSHGLRRCGSVPLRRTKSIKKLIKADINLRLDSESDGEDMSSPDSGDINFNRKGSQRSDSLTLTLDEVQHIRSAITKAEIEYIGKTKELRYDLENGRVCFTCLKTRFNLFNWGVKCKLCEKQICEKCATKMDIPRNSATKFDKIPVNMLIPSRLMDASRREKRSNSLSGIDGRDCTKNSRVVDVDVKEEIDSTPVTRSLKKFHSVEIRSQGIQVDLKWV